MATATLTKQEQHYGIQELLLVIAAAALVIFTIWYVRHTSTLASQTYSIHESSQKPVTPKKSVTTQPVTPSQSSTTTAQ